MSHNPWTPEKEVDVDLARILIQEQIAYLKIDSIVYFGQGFESTVFLVNKKYIFKFPRRAVSVGFLQQEIRILKVYQDYLPIEVPAPLFVGTPSLRYTWPFAGFSFVAGDSADFFTLTRQERADLAVPVAQFLKSLHSIPISIGKKLNIGVDPIGRLDFKVQHPLALSLLEKVANLHLFKECGVLYSMLMQLKDIDISDSSVLVHGDLYARHLLLNENKQLVGVIDWGESYIGNPAVDLALLFSFIPQEALYLFTKTYGDIDNSILRGALFRSIKHTLHCVLYAEDVKDDLFLQEALCGLSLIVQHSSNSIVDKL